MKLSIRGKEIGKIIPFPILMIQFPVQKWILEFSKPQPTQPNLNIELSLTRLITLHTHTPHHHHQGTLLLPDRMFLGV